MSGGSDAINTFGKGNYGIALSTINF